MPWKATEVMTERARFVLEWERRWKETEGRRVDIAELCRVFGISRPTGYLWLRRYREAGHDVRALEDRSCRPHRSPTAIAEEMCDFIVAARKQHPRWGPRMLRAWLGDRYPGDDFPSRRSRGNARRHRRRRH